MAHVGVKGRRTHSSCPRGLPWVLTVCRLLHQPPVLTEVVCGFAQDAAHGVILEDGEGRCGLSPAPSKEVCPAAQTPGVLDGGWGWGALRELGRSAPARLPLGKGTGLSCDSKRHRLPAQGTQSHPATTPASTPLHFHPTRTGASQAPPSKLSASLFPPKVICAATCLCLR